MHLHTLTQHINEVENWHIILIKYKRREAFHLNYYISFKATDKILFLAQVLLLLSNHQIKTSYAETNEPF